LFTRNGKALTAKGIKPICPFHQVFKTLYLFGAFSLNYQFWTHENHAVFIDPYIPDMYVSKIKYIHENAVKAGLVEIAEEYLVSSARDYANKKGLIKINFL